MRSEFLNGSPANAHTLFVSVAASKWKHDAIVQALQSLLGRYEYAGMAVCWCRDLQSGS